ncbi:MAG: hypothetical protein HUU54_17640, partial [Ignavibacteriaceae bacterium]|nr:hypothetical protein [Ignavibacteriaceae bacterium]
NYCELNPLLTGSIKKLWGTSSSDIYAVGELGNIAHWDGVSWKKIESGTDLDIFSITGSGNINSSQNIVGIAGSWQTGVSVIIQIDPKQLKVVQKTDKPFLLESGTIIKNRKYYFGGAGIFTSYNINSEFKLLEGHPNYFTHSIFAKDYNDVYGSRSFGVISHYNGYTWYHRTQYSINGMMPRYSIIRSYGDNVVAAGQVSNPNGININAAITIGKRN